MWSHGTWVIYGMFVHSSEFSYQAQMPTQSLIPKCMEELCSSCIMSHISCVNSESFMNDNLPRLEPFDRSPWPLLCDVTHASVLLSPFPPYTLPFSSFCLPSSPHTETDQPSLVWFDRGKFYLTFEGKSGFFTQGRSSYSHSSLASPSSFSSTSPSISHSSTHSDSFVLVSQCLLPALSRSSASQRSSAHVTQQPDLSLGLFFTSGTNLSSLINIFWL